MSPFSAYLHWVHPEGMHQIADRHARVVPSIGSIWTGCTAKQLPVGTMISVDISMPNVPNDIPVGSAPTWEPTTDPPSATTSEPRLPGREYAQPTDTHLSWKPANAAAPG